MNDQVKLEKSARQLGDWVISFDLDNPAPLAYLVEFRKSSC
jgi:hypothetical protein